MNTAEFIDSVSQHVLNKGGVSLGDEDTRARILFHAQTALKRRWNKRPWWFRTATDEIGVGVDGVGAMPANFSSFGQNGFVTNPAQRGAGPLTWRPQRDLLKMLEGTAGTSTTPRYYTLIGLVIQEAEPDEEPPIPFQRYWCIQVFRKPPNGIDVLVYYEKKAPLLVDEIDASGLEEVPDDFVETVLMSDVRAALMFDEGDTRSLEYEQKADRADAEMWAEHCQGRQQRSGSPRYGAGTFR